MTLYSMEASLRFAFSFKSLVLLLFFANVNAQSYKNVTITNGIITGQQFNISGRQGWEYLGIPFAEPPTGNLRFAKPQARRQAWTTPLMATKPAARCLQSNYTTGLDRYLPKGMVPGFSEDCLFLNVWTPANSTASPRTVMVWIHGGGYIIGEGFPYYNGRPLAVMGDVVVVTIQYRLGVFGFLRLSDSVGGNWGMWDQQLALRWVHENIAQFGGDPNSITIFGESAGASSVALHLLNKESARYYHRAILQSGTALGTWAANPNTAAFTKNHLRFTKHAGCRGNTVHDNLACLRKMKGTQLLSAVMTYQHPEGFVADWQPVVDGGFLKEDPLTTYMRGSMPKKDIMIGVNADEGGMLVLASLQQAAVMLKANISQAGVPPALNMLLTHIFRYRHYPTMNSAPALKMINDWIVSKDDPQNFLFNIRRLNEAYGDYLMVCPSNKMADTYVKGNSTIYFYQFNHRTVSSPYPAYIGATHAMEIDYVFGLNIVYPNFSNFTAAEAALSIRMMQDWSSFAKSGRPYSSNWKPFTKQKREYYKLDLTSQAAEYGLKRENCKFWTNIIPVVNSLSKKVKCPIRCEPLNTVAKVFLAVLCVLVGLLIIGIVYYFCRRTLVKNGSMKFGESA